MKGKVRFGILGAFVALAGVVGVVGSAKPTQVDAQIPAGLLVAKNCTVSQVAINGNATCTVTITATAAVSIAEPILVTVAPGATGAGANGAFGRARLLNATSGATGPDVDNVQITNPADGSTQTIAVNCTGITCDFAAGDVFTVTEGLQGVVGGTTTESIKFGPNAAVALTPAITVGPATVTATAVCTPASITAGSGAAGATSCVIDLNDNDAFPTVVSSSNITVTVIGPAGVVLSSTGGTTGAFNCGGANNAPQSCDSITVGLQSNTGGLSGNVTLQINYAPDLPAVDFPVVLTLTNAFAINAVGPAAAFVQPAGLVIACTSNADPLTGATGTFGFPAPSQLLSVNVIAVGVLPVSVGCTVRGVDATGAVLTNFAPGTIEVSSTGGTLVDAQGRLSTNLRIGCDNSGVTTVVLGAVIQTNTCTGVSFFVSGQGVGTVELRARYEPSSIAAVAGIQERETLANVGFVAPVVAPSLLLSPNPVVVGQTGTATVRFNRTINCTGAFTTGFASTVPGSTTSIAGGSVCIDPTTGQPIIFNLGSGLNGSVVLTIADTSVAQWATAVTPTNIASPQSTGFTDTVSQAVRRCGFFPTTGITAPFNQIVSTTGAGNLSNFFGGCDTVTATYRGVIAGVTNVTATFIPDLPGAFGNTVNLNGSQAALLGLFGPGGFTTSQRVLQVENAAPVGTVQLSRGCNNVSPTVSEAASAYAARVAPAAALVAIWEHQAATNTFRGFSPQAGAPSDLAAVTRLRPVFVCVSGAATLDQPAA